MNYSDIKQIQNENKKRWQDCVGKKITENSGIYILFRKENGFKYAYVGQAKHLLSRLADHLNASKGIFNAETQHVDFSLRKHGLYSQENIAGWNAHWIEYPEAELDDAEQRWMHEMADRGYQLRNKTTGSQSNTKKGLDVDHRQPKGYYDGLNQGYLNARREIAKLFKTNLIAQINGNDGVRKQKALAKFNDFINIGGEDEQGTEESDV